MRIRVRATSGVATLTVDGASTVAQLKDAIAAQLNIPSESQQLLCGFPPKQVVASDNEAANEYFKSGDTIVVRQSKVSNVGGAGAAAAISKPPAAKAAAATVRAPAPSSDSIAAHGTFVVRQVPDDNSCLFRAVNGLLGRASASAMPLRQAVADAVGANPMLYTKDFLGRPNAEYRAWILGDTAWGGAIELGILAQHYRIEIGAFDVKTMRMDRYGEGNGYPTVGYLIYDGIHYNYLALALGGDASSRAADVTQFDANDALAMEKARAVCEIAHQAKQYTDTQNFRIRCDDCGTILRGEEEVVRHANATRHGRFSEAS